jgi:hypothetical protein
MGRCLATDDTDSEPVDVTAIVCSCSVDGNIINVILMILLKNTSWNQPPQIIAGCYIPCPSHPPWPDHSSYTWQTVQVMKLLIMLFSPTSLYFFPLGPNILLSTLFSNTIGLCSSLNVRDQLSHPHKTTGKIIVLYILIVMYLNSTRGTKRF